MHCKLPSNTKHNYGLLDNLVEPYGHKIQSFEKVIIGKTMMAFVMGL